MFRDVGLTEGPWKMNAGTQYSCGVAVEGGSGSSTVAQTADKHHVSIASSSDRRDHSDLHAREGRSV